MNKIAAFFDFDQTMITTHTARLIGKYIHDENLRFFCGKRLSLLYLLKLLAVKQLSSTPLIRDEKFDEVLYGFYNGRSRKQLLEWTESFYDNYIEKYLAPSMIKKINDHKNKGHILIIVSGGINDILQVVKHKLKFDHLLCTELEVDNKGLYTGKPKGKVCMGKNKQLFALDIASKLNIDLKKSFSYGNHHSDIPVLEIVGNPYVVEPTKELFTFAETNGWPVLSFN